MSYLIICSGLCACTEMCVLYASFGSKVRPRNFGCAAMYRQVCLFLDPDFSYILQDSE